MGAAQSKEISVKSNGIAGMMIADVIRNAGRIAQIPACSGLVGYRDHLMPILKRLKGKDEYRITLKCDRTLIYETGLSYYKDKIAKSRDPKKQVLEKLVIVFTSNGTPEAAIDADGLRREFYSEFFKHAISGQHSIFEGNGRRLLPKNDANIISDKRFHIYGVAIVESILNGDCGFPYLHPAIYHYIFGRRNYEQYLSNDDVQDQHVKQRILKISEAKNNDELLDAIGTRDDELFDHIGWPKGKAITMESKLQIVQQFLHWNIIGKRLEAINQLRGGLKFLGFLKHLENEPLLEPLLVYSEEYSLTANYLQNHLVPLIEKLETKNKKEEQAKDFSLKAIKALNDVEAIELYTFITNLMDPPVNAEQLSVSFNREKPTMKYPDANVCASNLIIPLGNNSFEEFKESFSVALTNKFDYANV